MGLRLNFVETDEPKEGGFEPLPTGKYHCVITDMLETETKGGKAPGTPMVKCEFTVQSGKYENRKLWDNLVLSDEALWKTKALLYAIGFTEDEVKAEDFEFEPEEYIGRELDVRVGIKKATDEYDASNKVNGYAAHMTTDADLLS